MKELNGIYLPRFSQSVTVNLTPSSGEKATIKVLKETTEESRQSMIALSTGAIQPPGSLPQLSPSSLYSAFDLLLNMFLF